MALVTSILNLKGGVGKTTVTVALAEVLALQHRQRVLVIDLDPQSSATLCLMSQIRWAERRANRKTLYNLFQFLLDGSAPLSPEELIETRTSNLVGGAGHLHLIPCSIELIDIIDRMSEIGQAADYDVSPFHVLKDFISPLFSRYDQVLIDCPPTLSTLTRNGLLVSHTVLIPFVPDIISLIGVDPLLDHVRRIKEAHNLPLRPLGLLATRTDPRLPLHDKVLHRVYNRAQQNSGFPELFRTQIPNRIAYAKAMEWTQPFSSLAAKYGGSDLAPWEALAKEFLAKLKRLSERLSRSEPR